jgi:hypothetical protein
MTAKVRVTSILKREYSSGWEERRGSHIVAGTVRSVFSVQQRLSSQCIRALWGDSGATDGRDWPGSAPHQDISGLLEVPGFTTRRRRRLSQGPPPRGFNPLGPHTLSDLFFYDAARWTWQRLYRSDNHIHHVHGISSSVRPGRPSATRIWPLSTPTMRASPGNFRTAFWSTQESCILYDGSAGTLKFPYLPSRTLTTRPPSWCWRMDTNRGLHGRTATDFLAAGNFVDAEMRHDHWFSDGPPAAWIVTTPDWRKVWHRRVFFGSPPLRSSCRAGASSTFHEGAFAPPGRATRGNTFTSQSSQWRRGAAVYRKTLHPWRVHRPFT